jgi:glycosyltransferase involved in cell wall biosynthesis
LIYVGSLKYSPIYKSHCCAFGKACEEKGYIVRYLFSREYEWMLPPSVKENTVFIGSTNSISSMVKDTLNSANAKIIEKTFLEEKPTHVYLHNYHLLNHVIAKMCKKNGGKFIYHAHEPYVENKKAHGGLQQYWLYLNEVMEARLLRNTDISIVSSKEASRLFDKAYPWFKGKKLEIPLMYEDLGFENKESSQEKNKHITFVGPPVAAKGPEIFLKIADYAAKHQSSWIFTVISRERINNRKFLGRSNLLVYYKDHISDQEFGKIIQRSFVVLTPYKRETQSSVILVSYMHGTPVVSSNVGGMPEFVNRGKTGFLVSINAPVEEWIDSIGLVECNSQIMRINCRQFFEDRFSGKNWIKYLDELLA